MVSLGTRRLHLKCRLLTLPKIEITSCRVKYEEGFVKVFGHIFGKPETLWTQADRNLIIPTGKHLHYIIATIKLCVYCVDYSLCIGFSLQTYGILTNPTQGHFSSSLFHLILTSTYLSGTLLLLQCFWNYLANSVARANFMSSKEFKLYIIW